MPDKQLQNIQILESICSQGCTHVNTVIQILEAGENTVHTEALNNDERHHLLLELKSIMAVYLKGDE